MKIHHTLMATAALLVLSSGAALATDTKDFVKKAAIANQFEIESSQVALQRSSSADVKAFAQKMIDDHTKAGADFKAAASAGGIAPADIPTGLDEKHTKMLNDLKETDAEDFDDDYIHAQKKAHRKAVNLFEDYADDGDNEALKTFATNTVPTLKAHKDHIKEVDDAH